jgi:hypothetical protein
MDQFGYLDRDTPTIYHGFAIGRIVSRLTGHEFLECEASCRQDVVCRLSLSQT